MHTTPRDRRKDTTAPTRGVPITASVPESGKIMEQPSRTLEGDSTKRWGVRRRRWGPAYAVIISNDGVDMQRGILVGGPIRGVEQLPGQNNLVHSCPLLSVRAMMGKRMVVWGGGGGGRSGGMARVSKSGRMSEHDSQQSDARGRNRKRGAIWSRGCATHRYLQGLILYPYTCLSFCPEPPALLA